MFLHQILKENIELLKFMDLYRIKRESQRKEKLTLVAKIIFRVNK